MSAVKLTSFPDRRVLISVLYSALVQVKRGGVPSSQGVAGVACCLWVAKKEGLK